MRGAAAVLAAILCVTAWPARAAAAGGCSGDWPMYGHDVSHTFAQPCDPGTAPPLPRWVFRTADAVTASPAVAGGTLYAGDASGTFYALDAATGALRWRFTIDPTPTSVSFGWITSSAVVAAFPAPSGGTRTVVLFGGGPTLYALDAATGARLASLDLDPRTPADRAADAAAGIDPVVEIESSPAVVQTAAGPVIYVGMDVNEQPGVGGTGLVALRLSGDPGGWNLHALWKYDPETGRTYEGDPGLTARSHQGLGCGDVWSSPAVGGGAVVFGTANCPDPMAAAARGWNWSEGMYAVDAMTGGMIWSFHPAGTVPTAAALAEAAADDDFGASPNLWSAGGGAFAGEGQKSATYFARDLPSGAEAWTALAGQPGNLAPGNAVGGFIGSTALVPAAPGRPLQVAGATAVPAPDPADPSSLDRTTWAVRALDAGSGAIRWVDRLAAPAYGSTSTTGGVILVPDTFADSVLGLAASDGSTLWALPLDGPPSSTPVIAEGGLFVGAGTEEQPGQLAPLSGIWAFSLAG